MFSKIANSDSIAGTPETDGPLNTRALSSLGFHP